MAELIKDDYESFFGETQETNEQPNCKVVKLVETVKGLIEYKRSKDEEKENKEIEKEKEKEREEDIARFDLDNTLKVI